ncbi:MAG: hypothetical protein RJB13_1453 [Pseudomonadota bacterium]|jgi:predicted amidophosphoribosyltransferase
MARNSGTICFRCRQVYAGLRWSGCTRCGEHECSGACNELPWLLSVTSIYIYASFHRQLLILAKERQSDEAILVLFEVYGYQVVEKMKELIIKHSISTILIARVRIKRIVGLNWHPFEFWRTCACRALKELSESNVLEKSVSIKTFLPEGLKKRSMTSSGKRREQMRFSYEQTSSEVNSNSRSTIESVLILDDVLTSGGTILKESTEIQLLRRKTSFVEFHAMTLFRTPCKHKLDTKREGDGLEQTFF